MRKIVKRILAIVGGLLALAIVAILVKMYVLSPVSRPAPNVQAPTTPEAIERGRYLASSVAVCLACHSEVEVGTTGQNKMVDGRAGSGREFHDPSFPGKLRTPNLTPDKQFGLGNWTDGEILRAMREGVSKDGRTLFPMMPYKAYGEQLSDADALAIIAYLRTLPPIASSPGPLEVKFPASMFIRLEPKPVQTPAGPPPADQVARGNWIVSVAFCSGCHDGQDDHHQPIEGKRLAGGAGFEIPQGKVYAANISSDKETGIGAYSDEDILRVLNEGVNKSGRKVFEMPWNFYKGMTDEDKKAVIAALRASTPVKNAVPQPTLK